MVKDPLGGLEKKLKLCSHFFSDAFFSSQMRFDTPFLVFSDALVVVI